jgi:hypothetical protein
MRVESRDVCGVPVQLIAVGAVVGQIANPAAAIRGEGKTKTEVMPVKVR